jgi:hypothetical protein
MSSRPLAALASFVLAVLGFVFLIPDCAFACSCAIFGNQKEMVESGLSSSDAVFSGEVVDFEKSPSDTTMMEGTMFTIMSPRPATATLRVSDVWKGPERETLEVSTSSQETACGVPFEEGREYLVYAYGGQGLETDLCSQTKPLSEAGTDLAVLGAGKKPTGGDALSDTSGGVSVRAMVGVAGLVMAASLIVVVRLLRSGQT